MASLNLARKPFVNRRPLERVCALLIGLAVVLFLINSVLFFRYLSGSAGLRSQLRDVRAEVSAERDSIADLERQLDGFNLGLQNRQVFFLNQQIKQRTFGWGLLFERLGEALPQRVRLVALSPEVVDPRTRRNRDTTDPRDKVSVSLTGIAADSEQLLDFVDALFAHPAFETPQLLGESRDDRGEILFHLDAHYLPSVTEEAPVRVTANDEGTEAAVEGLAGGDEALPTGESSSDDPRMATLPGQGTPGVSPADPPPGDRSSSGVVQAEAPPHINTSRSSGQGSVSDDRDTQLAAPPRPSAADVRSRQRASSGATGRDSRGRSTTSRPVPTARGGGTRFQPGSQNNNPTSGQPAPRGTLTVPVMPTRNASSPGGRR